ncbi:MAG: hypothetical protein WAO83_24115 [Fuerstiella sp.]
MFLLPNSASRLIYSLTIGCLALFAVADTTSAGEWNSLELGYQGIAKVGKWLPVRATASNLTGGETVELVADFADPRGDTCRQILAKGTVEKDGTIALNGLACCGRLAGTGSVFIVAESGKVLCRKSIAHGEDVSPDDPDIAIQNRLKLYKLDVPLLMSVGKPAGVEELLRNADVISENRPILEGATISSLSEFPEDARGLDAIDFLLLSDSFATTDAQAETLKQWVRDGGRLLVTTGDNVKELSESAIGQWLNTYFEILPEPVSIRSLTSLQSYVSGGSRLETNRRTVPMAILQSGQSIREVDSLNGPIISTQSVGTGLVTMVAVDLNKPPVSVWNSLPQLYEILLFGEKLTRKTGVSSRSSRISQSGISDVSTQMMATIDAVPESGTWSTWSIMAMMVGWLILIGPVDYYLVTRILKKPHLTWVTFPILIVGGVAGTVWALGTNTTTQLNELHIVDVTADGDRSFLDVKSWMSISSPQTMKAEITATPASLESNGESCSLMWSGRPEDVYGGMYRTGGIGLSRQTYTHSDDQQNTLTGIPLLTDGSRQLFAEWHSASKEPLIKTNLNVSGFGLLDGTFTHNLPFPISDFMVMHGNRVYRMTNSGGELVLEPGQIWDSKSSSVAASDLKGFLNGSRLVKVNSTDSNRGTSQEITPYNAKSTDLQYMLTMATFYNVAGGVNYVGLSQDLLNRMELSDTIRLNHAVAIGVIDAPATSLSMNGTKIPVTNSKTFVRLLLPVSRRPSEKLAPTEEDAKKAAEAKAAATEISDNEEN